MSNLSDTSIQYVKGVGPARKLLFANLGVSSIEDLLYLFPRRYEDRRTLTKIAQAQVGEYQTVIGKVLTVHSRKAWHTKKSVTEVVLDDESGRISCTWFNQSYLVNYFKPGIKVVCYGKVGMYKKILQMLSPDFEIIDEDDEQLSLNRIVPIYPLTRGITQRYLRKTIKQCLDKYKGDLQDELSVALRNKLKLYNIKRSIEHIHFPNTLEDQEGALKRISFEEFYFFQISVILRRLSITQKPGVAHKITDAQIVKFMGAFPFALTGAQKRVIREIRQNMQAPSPMLRLLQGDVGSGKTLVALFGCWVAFENGYQSAVMAPTEILAQQHFETVTSWMDKNILPSMKVVLLTNQLKGKEREKTYLDIKNGNIDLVIGTHALINEDIAFKRLSFVVIDEQHKFGVRQRAILSKKGLNPDILIMTATPIPRTLCITLYGDLDVSIIDEIPPGRGKIITRAFSEEKAQEVYAMVRAKVSEGRQAYIVYPIIEESETSDLKAAKEMVKHFKESEFKDLRVELIHGQMKRELSEKIMQKFKAGEIDVLVATTVVEVGVDVANASVMVIEHAERFGLAQLHQLRGRIGRGVHDALCLLITNPTTTDGEARIKAILSTTDGFKIAQQDLIIRGPGQYFDRHQHGLSELKVANPVTQLDILELARQEAIELTKADPKLGKKENQRVKQIIRNRYPNYLEMVEAG